MRKNARKRREAIKQRYVVEFELIDAPGQVHRVHFETLPKARRFLNFPDLDIILRTTLL